MLTDDIHDRALAYVMQHDMLREHERVVAGISGGADSMCLLGLLLEWRERFDLAITVLHVNHGIRGAAADADEAFVESFCRENNVDFKVVHADVPKLAAMSGTTEEEAGRNLRYRVFAETASELNCTRIAVAHNRADNAETVVFNMLRGSGISGIKGISPVRKISGDITVIRPLLDISRKEIEAYLAGRNMSYRTDATNFDTGYSRNAIRNIVMPVFKERINSASEEHIVRLALQAAQIEEYLKAQADKVYDGMEENAQIRKNGQNESRINVGALEQTEPVIRSMIVRRMIGELAGKLKDIGNIHVDEVLGLTAKQSGKKADLPYGITALREYGDIVLKLKSTVTGADASLKDTEIIETDINELEKFTENAPFTVEIPRSGLPESAVLRLFVTQQLPEEDFTKNLCTKCFDCDKINDSVLIRNRKPGDYLLLRSGSGDLMRKSLKTWLIDNKIPAGEREKLVLVTEGSHVLWIVGYRRDDSYPVNEDTRRVLVMKLLSIKNAAEGQDE